MKKLFLLLVVMISCNTQEDVYRRFEKNTEKFNKKNFGEDIKWEQVYFFVGLYKTKREFDVDNASFLSDNYFTNRLYFYDDGKVLFFSDEYDKTIKNRLYKKSYNAVLIRKKNEFFIERIVRFDRKMDRGFGVYRQKVKFTENRILIQGDDLCYVYELRK